MLWYLSNCIVAECRFTFIHHFLLDLPESASLSPLALDLHLWASWRACAAGDYALSFLYSLQESTDSCLSIFVNLIIMISIICRRHISSHFFHKTWQCHCTTAIFVWEEFKAAFSILLLERENQGLEGNFHLWSFHSHLSSWTHSIDSGRVYYPWKL